MKYYNYHKHDHKGNVKSLDVVTKMEDYCRRAVELGHDAIFTTNHGIQGDIFEAISLGKQYNLKVIVGVEAYYVENRFEKDKGNKHIVIIALNDSGIRQINKIMSEANVNGYYYKPRIDRELLFALNPNDVVITTACVLGIMHDEDLVVELHNKFKDNFFLETQNHNEEVQKEWNKKAINLRNKYGIKIIHGNDSHYIYPNDNKYRDKFLKAKGIIYENEGTFILDYPDSKTIVDRYRKQGVLSDEEILESLTSTLIFEQVEEIKYINEDVKLPTVSNNPNRELKEIIAMAWAKEKVNIPQERISEYEDAIRYEVDIIEKTRMENYFILDYKIVKRGNEKYNGMMTKTGRGSAPSFYINKLLGLTDIDRLSSPITLFPTRFMSAERILLAKSLPDIDLNCCSREEYIKATEDLLGEENCAWMISWKPMQDSSAFRLWCKANDMDIKDYDDIAKNIDEYREHPQWKDLIEQSKVFVGVVESISESPCSMLVYDKNIAEEVGLIKTEKKVCCLLDGYNCDKFKYLKNDLLSVTVWDTIRKTYEMIGIEVPSIEQFNKLLDDKTFDIYKNGLTSTINQVDSDWATNMVKRYAPRTLAEVSAYVAAIRPGFASLLDNFTKRLGYTTGVDELDLILQDSYHYLMYQESIMKYLVWLGIEEKETYDIIKKIAKKKFKQQELTELKAKLKSGWINVVGKEEGFDETWQVVEDASKYSFNASHSLSYAYDSLYGAYLKSHYPLEYFSVVMESFNGDSMRTTRLTDELSYFNISLNPPKWKYSKGSYFPSKETNSIYKGIGSIKYLNVEIGDELYNLANSKEYKHFLELLVDLTENTSINSRGVEILIKLNFFSDFGKNGYLLSIYDKFKDRYKKTHKDATKLARLTEILEYSKTLDNNSLPLKEVFEAELEFQGYISYIDKEYTDRVCVVTEVKENKWGTVFVALYRINSGSSMELKVDKKYFANRPLSKYDVINVGTIDEKFKRKKVDNKWVITDDKEYILSSYGMVVD